MLYSLYQTRAFQIFCMVTHWVLLAKPDVYNSKKKK